MFDPAVAALFPLPLTTFEKYMFWDDRPEYPMVFAVRMKLRGELHRADFESSLNEALAAHPLLCALVKRTARNGPVWTLSEERRPTVDWNVPGVPIGSPRGEGIDLNSEVGLRVWGRQGGGVAEVTLQFHHACCDGIGALRFIGHVLAAYGMRTASAGRRPTLPPGSPEGLVRRGSFAAGGSWGRGFWANVRDAVRWVGRRSVILCPRAAAPAAAAPPPFLEMHRHIFDESEKKKIQQAGTRQGVKVNDLLLRDLFLTLRQWNAERESRSAKRWYRIAVPVYLKTGKDVCPSADNGVSYNFLTRQGNQYADSHEFLKSICRETDMATCRRRALMFLRGVQFIGRLPGGMPLYLGANRCFATVVLSNVGDIRRQFGAQFPHESGKIIAGNLILEDIFGAPPVRANTRAAFLIGSYAKRFWVCLRCDPRVFPADDARRLLSEYVACIKKTMAEATDS
ncbi:MAG: hypothetical protein JXB10_02865 [Pirellulales bacterium]|nr:hypothetical protein [Pirellulales bacterium]